MEIIHLNNDDSIGGASKFAERLVNFQRKHGIQSKLLVGTKFSTHPWVHLIPLKRDMVNFRNYYENGKLYDWNLPINFLNNYLVNESSLIHIHNVSGDYLNCQSLLNLFRQKRIVWTLHDKFLFTGHCSQPLNCELWRDGCGNCPSLSIYPPIKKDSTAQLYNWKRKHFINKNIHFVLPSKEMEVAFKQSYLKDQAYSIINNGINTSLFKPVNNKDEVKRKLGIPRDKIILMGSAVGGVFENKFKGSELYKDILAQLKNDYGNRFVFLNVGVTSVAPITSDDDSIINIPFQNNEEKYAELLAVADIFLFPSIMESFGLAPLEAMSCGVAVVSSDAGILSEVIQDGKNGFIVNSNDKFDYLDKIILLMDNLELRKRISYNARESIQENYDLEKLSAQYKSLYEHLLLKDCSSRKKIAKRRPYKLIVIEKGYQEKNNWEFGENVDVVYLNKIEELWEIQDEEGRLVYVYYNDEKHSIDTTFFNEIIFNNLKDELIFSSIKTEIQKNVVHSQPTITFQDNRNRFLINLNILSSFVFRLDFLKKNYKDIVDNHNVLVHTFSCIDGGYFSLPFTELFNRLTFNKEGHLYIYGFGGHTKSLIQELKEVQLDSIKGIVHKGESGIEYKGLKIQNINEFSSEDEITFLISSKSYEEEIFLELNEKFPRAKLIRIYGK